jgi:hypothetical protein
MMNLQQACCSRSFRVIVSLAAVFLSSCQRNDKNGLMERVDALEAELTTRNEKIDKLLSELKSLEIQKSQQQPEVDLAKASYKVATEDLASALRTTFNDGARLDDIIVNDVVVNDPAYPITSAVDAVFTTKNGNWRVKLPMRATTKGRWENLQGDALNEALKSARQVGMAQQAASQPTRQNQPAETSRPAAPRDVMGARKTEVIDWGDSPPSRNAPPQQTQQPAAPAPAQKPAVPPKVMPTNRDVMIDFGD